MILDEFGRPVHKGCDLLAELMADSMRAFARSIPAISRPLYGPDDRPIYRTHEGQGRTITVRKPRSFK